MSEEIKTSAYRWIESFNSAPPDSDWGFVDEFFAPNYVGHSGTRVVQGADSLKKNNIAIRQSFPDLQVTMDDLIIEGDKAAVRLTFEGTHKGEFQGVPPTNKKVIWTSIAFGRYENGKWAEVWQLTDNIGLLQQIGGTST